MTNFIIYAASIMCLLLTLTASGVSAASPKDFVGRWVMTVGHKTFLVLTINGDGAGVTGSLRRPQHFQTSGAPGGLMSFSHVSPDVEQDAIVQSSYEVGRLRFVAKAPADKGSGDEYEMTLAGGDQASLSLVGFVQLGGEPWAVSRVHDLSKLAVATDWDPNRSYLPDDSVPPNAEMQGIIAADQKARQTAMTLTQEQWAVIAKQDAERREATRRLLAAGSLHAAQDFASAAFIFQHGDTPEDYLLAHTLALVAVAKGDAGATWIAAATLDRYLNSIGKPQIYGTQFHNKGTKPFTQEPYNRALISNALRRQLGVPPLSAQEEQRKRYNAPVPKSTQPPK